jgi:hypothetical protein
LFITTLQFQTPQTLSNFKKKVSVTLVTMNLGELTLTGNYSQEQVDSAMKNFSATVIKRYDREFAY